MKKDLIKMLVVFVVAAGAVFWALNYLFLSGNTAQKSKASGETIEVSYDPATVTVASGADTTVMVKMKPSSQISLRGYSIKFKFDKAVLKAKYIDYKIGVPSPEFGDTSATLASINENGVINIQGEIQNSTGLIMNGNSTVDLVRLVFTATTAAGTNLDGSNANFYIVESDGVISTSTTANVPDLKINGGAALAACTSFSDDFSASALNATRWKVWSNHEGTVTISANGEAVVNTPATTDSIGKSTNITTQKAVSGDFTAEAILKSVSSSSASGSGYLTGLGFYGDPFDGFGIERLNNGQLRVLYDWNNTDWVTPTIVSTSLSSTAPVKVKISRTGTKVDFYYDLLDGGGYRLAKSFTGAYSGSASFVLYANNFAPDYPQVTGRFDNFALTCAAGSNPTATPTPTGTTGAGTPTPTPTGSIPVTGNVKITLKLKFQGIGGKPADARNSMNVKFTLGGADLATQLVKSGTFTSDANGVWTGKVGFDLTAPAGKKYTLYIKGPKHVQKKICDVAPTENAAGTYRCSNSNVTLAVGENTLDISKVLLLSGDVYGPNKVQDGVVNAVDISYIKNNLGKTDAGILGICDINLDGKCDTQDYSLIISALSIKSDEL